jgi:hypothetical protein
LRDTTSGTGALEAVDVYTHLARQFTYRWSSRRGRAMSGRLLSTRGRGCSARGRLGRACGARRWRSRRRRSAVAWRRGGGFGRNSFFFLGFWRWFLTRFGRRGLFGFGQLCFFSLGWSGFFGAWLAGLGRGLGRALAVTEGHQRGTDVDRLALLDVHLLDLAGERRGDFDGGLVGFDFGEGLVLLNILALLHQHAHDLGLMNPLSKVRQNEIAWH